MKNPWILALLLLALSLPGVARLGGGNSYSSGSRSSSSSRSSSGSSSGSRSSSGSSSGSRSSSGYNSGSRSSSGAYSSGRSYSSQPSGGGDYSGSVYGGRDYGGIGAFIGIPCILGGCIALLLFSNLVRDWRNRGESNLDLGARPVAFMAGLVFVAFVCNYQLMTVWLILMIINALRAPGGDAVYDPAQARPVAELEPLLRTDPNFSLPVFREFAVLLYCQAIQESVNEGFQHSRPYLSPAAAQTLATRTRSVKEITDVVVGTCQLLKASVSGGNIQLSVRLETNYLKAQGAVLQQIIANETWTFERKQGVLTTIAEGVSKLACPSCGFGGEFPSSGQCPQCTHTNQHGKFDWVVASIQVESLEPIAPFSVDGEGPTGIDLPTAVHPDLGVRQKEFLTRHPEFRWEEFHNQVTQIFLKLQQAWTERDWSKARPHETDVLFRTHRFWIESYRRAGRINRLENIQIRQWQLSNIVLDAIYESVTLRIDASMIDVTVDDSGRHVLSGNRNTPRPFSEYWTFIRRVGHKKACGDFISQCPSCGAPLDRINQAGVCEYCQTLVTRGDFDWVLSCIEQAEVYRLSI